MSERHFQIERTTAPEWVRAGTEVKDWHTQVTGEQAEWGWAIPLIHQVIAAPQANRPFPARPADNSHDVALAYWAALLHLLIYSFGWSRPDRGMRWWYDAGRPTDDDRLRLIAELWGDDGQLDWFTAWLWTSPQIADLDRFEQLARKPMDRRRIHVDTRWLQTTIDLSERAGIASPSPSGGSDPLHLSSHCSGPIERTTSAPAVTLSPAAERRGTVLVDSMTGWYRALFALELPDVGSRSWRLDVIAKPVGYLGTYRRSRDTGLWFAGPHSIHVQGN